MYRVVRRIFYSFVSSATHFFINEQLYPLYHVDTSKVANVPEEQYSRPSRTCCESTPDYWSSSVKTDLPSTGNVGSIHNAVALALLWIGVSQAKIHSDNSKDGTSYTDRIWRFHGNLWRGWYHGLTDYTPRSTAGQRQWTNYLVRSQLGYLRNSSWKRIWSRVLDGPKRLQEENGSGNA